MFFNELNSSQEHENKLHDMINELSNTLTTIKHDQEYMEVRDRIHRASKPSFDPHKMHENDTPSFSFQVNDNTNSRVVLWACFEAFVLLTMVAYQIYYLKRFFEIRRIV